MHWLKSAYVGAAQGIGHAPLVGPGLARIGRQRRGRWLASLFAIYDIETMIRLDVPWWNVAATREVERFLAARQGRARVFEWGSGASTVWMGRRCASLTSIEHDAGWAAQLSPRLAATPAVELLSRPLGEADGASPYVDAILGTGRYDLIVVDGRRRADCLARAVEALAPGGLILFDDSGRRRYRAAIEGCGLPERHLFGLSYCVPYPDHTSLIGPA